jgi:tetratricopeptide (TPR) repeat protein
MTAELQRLDDESKLDLTDAERRLVESIRSGESGEMQDADGTNAVRRSLEIQTLANLADKAFSRARYTSAEQLYRTLYEFQPDHVPGLVNLGTILLYRNKCEEATEFLTRATRLAPELPITYYLSGICHYRLDQMEEAERMFTRTIELDPANAEAFFYLANIEAISGRTREALTHFAASVKLQSNLHDAHYNMSRLYAEAGNIPDAARAYDRAVQAGAEPDMEFENYLRNHPDNAQQPGDDLVEQVQPEAEAQKIKKERNPEAEDAPEQPAEQPAEGEPQPAEGEQQPATDAEPTPEVDPAEAERQAVLEEIARLTAAGGKAAPTPSDAGRSTKVDKKLFGTKVVRVKRGRHTKKIRLRLKRPQPQRLRESGGDIKVITPAEPEKKLKKTKKSRGK